MNISIVDYYSGNVASVTNSFKKVGDELDNNILSWSDIGDTNSWTVTNLSLNNASTYRVFIRALDVAGNLSSVVSTNGVVIDTEIPQAGSVMVDL